MITGAAASTQLDPAWLANFGEHWGRPGTRTTKRGFWPS